MWIAFLFASLFSNTGYSIVARRTFNKVHIDPIFLAAIMATSVAVPGMPGIFIAKINWGVYDLRLGLILAASVACATVYHFVNAKALELTEASVFSIFYNFQIGFATLMGITIFGESFVPMRLFGGILVFAAGLVLAGKGTAHPAGVFFSILTAALIATLSAFDKYLMAEAGFAEYVFPSKLMVAAALWIIVIVTKRHVCMEFVKSRWCPILMCFRCVAAYGLILALSMGALLSVSTYIASLSCVTTPIAAYFLLKEKGSSARKATAAAIALAGVTFIFIAARGSV